MADVIIDSDCVRPGARSPQGAGRLRLQDNGFHLLTLSAALAVLLILGGVIASLVDRLAFRPSRPSASAF